MKSIDRRSFIASAAAAAAGSACFASAAQAAAPVADNGTWDDEADIIICGAGVAGLNAACTASFESLGTTINLEASPENLAGGNSASTVGVLFCPNDVESAKMYQAALDGYYHNFLDEKIFDVWANDIVLNKDWMEENYDCTYNPNIGSTGTQGEFPAVPGADGCPTYRISEGLTWDAVKEKFDELELPIYYDARAMRLVVNEEGVVIGVECEDGRRFKAHKGVLLATGGFESSAEMMRTYMPAGYSNARGIGGWYNRGDGIKMAMTMGADLIHMSNISGAALGLRIVPDDFGEDARAWCSWSAKSYIYVDQHGRRFMDENIRRLHGKTYFGGTFIESPMPEGAWAIFDQAIFEGKEGKGCIYLQNCFSVEHGVDCFHSNQEALEAGSIFKCDTVADLAAATGLPEAELQKTLERYNGFAAQNFDEDFGRGRATNDYNEPVDTLGSPDDLVTRAAFDLVPIEPPYYCVRLYGAILNTQGGPKRSADCEIIDVFGEPIPRLYSAGEMGCEYDYVYNAGGNISEAISSGRRAVRIISALDPIA
ncbi:MAG: FAD-binding protein [Coriobacteriales bacterium]|nr:FAD-binding protein [Coriobacteriales bacterium]